MKLLSKNDRKNKPYAPLHNTPKYSFKILQKLG